MARIGDLNHKQARIRRPILDVSYHLWVLNFVDTLNHLCLWHQEGGGERRQGVGGRERRSWVFVNFPPNLFSVLVHL